MTSPISTNHNVITGLFDPIIPGNLALDIAEKAIPRAVPSVFNLYRDKQARDHFKKYKSLSIPPGASFEIIPMFVENNQFYQLHDSIFIIDYPYFGHRKERFSGMIENPEISDLRQHLRTWQSYFRRAIEECPHHPESQDQEFQAFYEGYKDWLYSSDRNIEGQLRTLESPNI